MEDAVFKTDLCADTVLKSKVSAGNFSLLVLKKMIHSAYQYGILAILKNSIYTYAPLKH